MQSDLPANSTSNALPSAVGALDAPEAAGAAGQVHSPRRERRRSGESRTSFNLEDVILDDEVVDRRRRASQVPLRRVP